MADVQLEPKQKVKLDDVVISSCTLTSRGGCMDYVADNFGRHWMIKYGELV